jgi:hypothetical protein
VNYQIILSLEFQESIKGENMQIKQLNNSKVMCKDIICRVLKFGQSLQKYIQYMYVFMYSINSTHTHTQEGLNIKNRLNNVIQQMHQNIHVNNKFDKDAHSHVHGWLSTVIT